MASAMAKRKLKKSKDKSSVLGVKPASQEEMTQREKYMFSLAALALVVAVCAVPLTAETSSCKYPRLLTSETLVYTVSSIVLYS